MAGEVDIATLLASPAFMSSRRAVRHLADRPDRLRELISSVENKRFPGWDPHDPLQRVPVDIACAVIDARVEELETLPRGAPIPGATERLSLVVAALHYFARDDDLIPDQELSGHIDDVMLLRWAVHQVQSELPVEG
ncbi:hypothetical protein [Demetria terragena]|uniref:hypothetical protein n=1 Tax=Demetria terragena TaxID=63959 RepID=UPI00035EAAE4|nr:hypothetical protein [Demetria terragena]